MTKANFILIALVAAIGGSLLILTYANSRDRSNLGACLSRHSWAFTPAESLALCGDEGGVEVAYNGLFPTVPQWHIQLKRIDRPNFG